MQRFTFKTFCLALVLIFNYGMQAQTCSTASAGVISASSTSACAESSATSTLTSVGSSTDAGITHQWYYSVTSSGPYTVVPGGTGANTPTYTTPPPSSGIPAGTYYFVMITTCSVGPVSHTSNEVSLIVHPTPTISISPGSPTICSGNTTTLTASGAGTGGTYTWTSGPTTNTYAVSPTSNTNYSVTGTSSAGCSSSLTPITVTVSATPTIIISPATPTVCVGNTLTLTASGAGTGGTYTWTGGPTTNTYAVAPVVNTTYSVTGTNSAGCVSLMASKEVTANPLPSSLFAIVSPTQTCAGDQATITVGGANVNTMVLTMPSGNTFVITSTAVVAQTVTSTFTLTGYSIAGCTANTTASLDVLPTPTITSSASPTSVCQGDPVTLSANGADTYTWNSGWFNGAKTGTLVGQTVVYNPTTTPVTSYTVEGTDINTGCTNRLALKVQTVSVKALPNLSVTPTSSYICISRTVGLIASGANTYAWNVPGFPTTPSIVVSPPVATTYTVAGTSTTTGCQTTKTVMVNVFAPVFNTIPTPTYVCRNNTITLYASGAGTYTWVVNSVSVTASTVAVSPTVATNYVIGATSTSLGLNCSNTSTIHLDVYENPTVTVKANRNPICQWDMAEMTSNGYPGTITYTWSGGVSTSSVASESLTQTKNYTVTGTDEFGCHSNAAMTISVGICYGVEEIQGNSIHMELFPNPNNGLFTVRSDATINLTIVNEIGQTVKTIKVSASNEQKIDVSDLSAGIYFVVGSNSEGMVKKKIIISK